MWLYYFITFYIITVSLVFNLQVKMSTKNFLYLVAVFGLFFLLSALRSSQVGNDTEEYLRIFRNISLTNDFSNYTWRFEQGYLYLNKILGIVTKEPQSIIIITSLIIMYGYGRFIFKYSDSPMISTYFFFTLGYYGMAMNTIRQNIALVILLYSYDFLRNKKLYQFVFIVIIASLFHRTAIFFLIAWVILKFEINKKTLLTFIIVSLILYSSFEIIFKFMISIFPTYTYYVESIYLDGNLRIASVVNLLLIVFMVLVSVLIKSTDISIVFRELTLSEKLVDSQNFLLLILAGISITFISFKFNLLDRVGDYFLIYLTVYLPNAVKALKDRKLKIVIFYSLFILLFVYSVIINKFRPEWNSIFPYSFFWS